MFIVSFFNKIIMLYSLWLACHITNQLNNSKKCSVFFTKTSLRFARRDTTIRSVTWTQGTTYTLHSSHTLLAKRRHSSPTIAAIYNIHCVCTLPWSVSVAKCTAMCRHACADMVRRVCCTAWVCTMSCPVVQVFLCLVFARPAKRWHTCTCADVV